MKLGQSLPLIAVLLSVVSLAAEVAKTTWNFENDEPGKIAKGFSNEVGQWEVAKDGDNHVLAQRAKNDDATFNVALVEGINYKDVDLSVRLRAVAGEVDRGGGVVWRAKDAKNYYIARYNPLEDNFRVYKVVGGKRHDVQECQNSRRRDVAHSSSDDGRLENHLLLGRPEASGNGGCDTPSCRENRPVVQGRRPVIFR